MRCLVFGYGYMGKIRCRVLREHPEVRSIRIVDPEIQNPPAEVADFFLPKGAPIPWEETDAVFICTPNHITADLCAQALRRCGRVFCEKPPGRNWEEFGRIAEAAQEDPARLVAFGFNHRLHPSIQVARALIGKGGLGEILYVKGTYGKSGGLRFKENWRNNPELAGGGILLDQGIHMLDLMLLFSGPLSVQEAILNDSFWRSGLEDNAFLLLRSEQQVPVFLHSSATLWKHTFRLEIGCSEGYLIANGLLSQSGSYGREQLIIGRRQFEDETLAVGNPREEIVHFDRDESWQKEVDEFIQAIRENRPCRHGTLEDARQVMRIIRDVYAMRRPCVP